MLALAREKHAHGGEHYAAMSMGRADRKSTRAREASRGGVASRPGVENSRLAELGHGGGGRRAAPPAVGVVYALVWSGLERRGSYGEGRTRYGPSPGSQYWDAELAGGGGHHRRDTPWGHGAPQRARATLLAAGRQLAWCTVLQGMGWQKTYPLFDGAEHWCSALPG